jgi:LPXTG-motif cell wall-anchored protein
MRAANLLRQHGSSFWGADMRLGAALRWLAVAGVILTLGAATGASAVAQSAATYRVSLFDMSVGAGGFRSAPFLVSASPAANLQPQTKVDFIFDASDLAGDVYLQLPPHTNTECTEHSRLMVVCHQLYGLYLESEPRLLLFSFLSLRGEDTAKAGATGQLLISMKVDDVVVATDSATVTIGENVNLVHSSRDQVSAPFGQALPLEVGVRNEGAIAVRGAYLLFSPLSLPYQVEPATKHSNCNYLNNRLLFCRFDGDLAPGKRYVARPALKISADVAAPASENITVGWFTPVDWEHHRNELLGWNGNLIEGTPGTGPALPLVEAAASSNDSLLPQPDVQTWDNFGAIQLAVTGDQKGDLAAVGASVAGQQGSIVSVRVGVENKDAATIPGGSSFHFSLPGGTTVTKVPADCSKVIDTNKYRCQSVERLPHLGHFVVTFELRIDTATAGQPGKVAVFRYNDSQWQKNYDANTTNNEADVVVTQEALPVTGARVNWIVAGGALLVGAGLVLLRLFRRRLLTHR